ncbi:uncharacterized protein LOC128559128 [Mercenaria mercenaria]|uniref:uncharacterized protein LOC128559128 n=1 Tax=Mercenaria mercenaria TaxID=6596 RepID=UPI00234ED2B0|nr:uncharacterized protein LOC128559128 [Mercenaria mercenaria]
MRTIKYKQVCPAIRMDIRYRVKMKLCIGVIIQFILHYVVMNYFLLTPTNALEQPQLILKANKNSILNSQFASYLERVKVLKPNNLCSFKNLTECHYSEELYNLYYDTCFTEQVCPKENYYCINGDGYTIHICGQFSDCTKRKRNIVLYNVSNPDFVDAFSIPCPDGYFQFSSGNCFYACVKDDSIVVIKKSTIDTHAQGYCNFERNFCNPDGFTSFPLDSQHDNCVDVSYNDHGLKCDDNKDLMPNCSCVPSCMPGQVRTYDSHFVCQWRNGSGLSYATLTPFVKVSVPDGVTTTHGYHTSQTAETNDRTKDGNQDNDQSLSTLALVAIAIVLAVVMAIVVISLVCMAYKLLREKDNRGGPVLYSRAEDKSDEDSVHLGNGITPGPVINKKSKKVINNTTNIQANGDVYVHPGNGHAMPNINSQDIDCEFGSSRCGVASVDEPEMENLKLTCEYGEEADSANLSSETTYVKRTY